MGRELLIDTMPLVLQLDESEDGKIRFKGRFGLIGKPTKNKRRYPESIMRREINGLQEAIGRRRVLAELDHPRDGISSLTKSAAVIEALDISGDEIIGCAEALDTPNGRILSALAKAGVEVGVSSRGFGSTTRSKNEDVYDVGDDFKLETYDFVYNPAAEGAYPSLVAEAFEAEEKLAESATLTEDEEKLAEEIEVEMDEAAIRAKVREELKSEFRDRNEVELAERVRREVEKAVSRLRAEESEHVGDGTMVDHQPAESDIHDSAQFVGLQSQVKQLESKLVEQRSLMAKAGLTIVAERALRDVGPERRAKVLGAINFEAVKTSDELEAKINGLLEAEDPPPDYQTEAVKLQGRVKQLEAGVRDAYVKAVVEHHPEGQELAPMLENATDEVHARKIVEGFIRMREIEAKPSRLRFLEEQIRAKMSKGLESSITEETDGDALQRKQEQEQKLVLPGVTAEQWDRFMGR